MATRAVISAAAAVVFALSASGCGDKESPAFSKEVKQQMDAYGRARGAKVNRLISEGALPPVARNVLDLNGGLNVNFIDGPNGDNDVVRTEGHGTRGSKLVWDLNGNGKIDASERTITERELYDATLGPR
jgi:hypothetical protein